MPTDSALTWNNVDGGSGGSATIAFRYALGNTDRTANLIVNGDPQPVTFMSTQTWTNWSEMHVSVSLQSGMSNTVTIETTGEDAGNIDEMYLCTSSCSHPGLLFDLLEAEDDEVIVVQGKGESNHAGFSGTGFVNPNNVVGSIC